MKKECSCRFCDIVNGIFKYDIIDKPFADDENYYAIASIGAIVEGWLLIVPKSHILSMKNCYSDRGFVRFVDGVIEQIAEKYGRILFFEHGATIPGSSTACGTDHAHLHLVPMNESLIDELHHGGMEWMRCCAADIASMTIGEEYLFYTELDLNETWDNHLGYLHILKKSQSQFFRRIIAMKAGRGNEYDYKHFPFIENSRNTRALLESISA